MTNRRTAEFTAHLAGLTDPTPRQAALLDQLRSDQAAAARTDELTKVWRREGD